MQKFSRYLACILLAILLCQNAVLAAHVTISGGKWTACGLSPGDFISEVAETEQNLFFMITDGETHCRDMILCIPQKGNSPTVYLTADAGAEENMWFLSMAPAGEDRLWAVLGDLRKTYRVVVLQNGEQIASVACNSKPVLGDGWALWQEGQALMCWNGAEIFQYSLPAGCVEAEELALLNGSPCFVDWHGNRVVCLWDGGQNKTLFSLPSGESFQTASLISCGKEAYLSYHTASKSGVIRLSDGRQLLETSGTFVSAWQQADGTDQLALAVGVGNLIEYAQLSICDETVSYRHVETYLPNTPTEQPEAEEDGLPTGWQFTDSNGSQWIFYFRPLRERGAVTRVLSDGTAVRYLAETLEPQFPLYVWGAAVDFETSPYLSDTGHTMVPVRGIAGILNAEVVWNSGSRTVTVRQGEHIISLTIGAQTADVDGVSASLEVPAVIVEGRAMVPLRFLAEALGWTVRWENRAVYIE